MLNLHFHWKIAFIALLTVWHTKKSHLFQSAGIAVGAIDAAWLAHLLVDALWTMFQFHSTSYKLSFLVQLLSVMQILWQDQNFGKEPVSFYLWLWKKYLNFIMQSVYHLLSQGTIELSLFRIVFVELSQQTL